MQRRAQLRGATVAATSNAELNTSLLRLNGPVLGRADLAKPSPLLKTQGNEVFHQAQWQINRERTALPELLSTSFVRLLLAPHSPSSRGGRKWRRRCWRRPGNGCGGSG